MLTATLSSFLLDGTVGTVKCGLTQDQVLAELGIPTDVSIRQNPAILKYGSLELSFEQNRGPRILNFIGFYFHRPLFIPNSVQLIGWWPQYQTTFSAFCERLRLSEILFEENPLLTFEDQVTIRVGAGVDVCFARQTELQIDSMQYYAPTTPAS